MINWSYNSMKIYGHHPQEGRKPSATISVRRVNDRKTGHYIDGKLKISISSEKGYRNKEFTFAPVEGFGGQLKQESVDLFNGFVRTVWNALYKGTDTEYDRWKEGFKWFGHYEIHRLLCAYDQWR